MLTPRFNRSIKEAVDEAREQQQGWSSADHGSDGGVPIVPEMHQAYPPRSFTHGGRVDPRNTPWRDTKNTAVPAMRSEGSGGANVASEEQKGAKIVGEGSGDG